MPVPVRRACDKCVKAKRRCDLAVPCCYRCRVRALTCVYENIPTPPAQQPLDSAFNFNIVPTANGTLTSNSSESISPSTGLSSSIYSSGDVALPSFPDFDLDWGDIMSNMKQYEIPDRLPVIRPCPSMPDLLNDRAVYQARVVYGTSRLKVYPRMLLETGATPFIHTTLYEDLMPEPIQDALSACALIASRNGMNETTVHRVINEKARAWVSCIQCSSTRLDRLARVQALVIFQIIRLFDGDIGLRAEAEASIDAVDALLMGLQDFVTPAGSVCAQKGMRMWVFEESVRRTLIIGLVLQRLYLFMKKGPAGISTCPEEVCFTANRDLWNAQSEYVWSKVPQNSHKAVYVMNLLYDFDELRPEDLDEFGVLMIVLTNGVEKCADWLGWDAAREFGMDCPLPSAAISRFKSFINPVL